MRLTYVLGRWPNSGDLLGLIVDLSNDTLGFLFRAVLPGGHGKPVFERVAEMRGVLESVGKGDLGNIEMGKAGAFKRGFAFLQPGSPQEPRYRIILGGKQRA